MFIRSRTALVLVLLFETGLFYAASLLHTGAVVGGYMHSRAAIAEGVIGTILAAGVVLALLRPAQTPQIALWAQAIALTGTLVGAFTIAIGIGPQTRVDHIYHAVMLTVLTLGILAARQAGRSPP